MWVNFRLGAAVHSKGREGGHDAICPRTPRMRRSFFLQPSCVCLHPPDNWHRGYSISTLIIISSHNKNGWCFRDERSHSRGWNARCRSSSCFSQGKPPPPRMLPLSLLILASAPYFFTFHSFSDHLNASTAFFPGYFVVELSNLPTLSNEG